MVNCERYADHVSLPQNDNKIIDKTFALTDLKSNEDRMCQKKLRAVLIDPVKRLPVRQVSWLKWKDVLRLTRKMKICGDIDNVTNPIIAAVTNQVVGNMDGARSKGSLKSHIG